MSPMKSRTLATLAVAGVLALAGCATTGGGPTIEGSHAKGEAAVGAGFGAVLGAVIGHQSGNTAAGAAIGAAVGGAVGYLHGHAEDIAAANKIAAEARRAGDTAQVETATAEDPSTHRPIQTFKGFHLRLPAGNVERQDPQTMVMLRQCGALATKVNTDAVVSGPPQERNAVTSALALPPQRVQYVPVNDDHNIQVNVVATSA